MFSVPKLRPTKPVDMQECPTLLGDELPSSLHGVQTYVLHGYFFQVAHFSWDTTLASSTRWLASPN